MDVDWAGNEVCGQDFMGGTICSDIPGHVGACSAICQTCSGDWINDTCGCYERCTECGARVYQPSELDIDTLRCEDCRTYEACGVGYGGQLGRFYCELPVGHRGDHEVSGDRGVNWTPKPDVEPVTQDEIYEVFGITR